jgi:SAM-dependent methyltransferase
VAQPLIRGFVRDLAARVDLPEPVVEFGSLQVEPSQDADLRPLFAGRDFTGADLRAGPGVDRVEDLRALTYGDGEVGTALCLDTLEHCQDPLAACRELHRVTAPGGVCAISSVLLFGIHGYPEDYFRFTPEAFRSLLGAFDDVWVAGIGDPGNPMQVVGVAAKGRRLGLALPDFPSLAAAQREWDEAAGRVRVGPFLARPGELARLMAAQAPRVAADLLARRRKGA